MSHTPYYTPNNGDDTNNELQRLFILNNLTNHYSNIVYEYQRVMYNQPFFNTSIENYSNIIQDYQRDMNMFLSIVRQDSIRASLRPNVIPMPAPAPAPESMPIPIPEPPPPPQPQQPSQTVQYVPPSANRNTLYDPSGASVHSALESVNMNYGSDSDSESERDSVTVSGIGPSDSSTTHSFLSTRNARTPPVSRTNTRTVSGGGGGWNGGFTATYVLTRQGRNRNTNANTTTNPEQPLMEDVVVAPTQEQICNAVERIFIEQPDPNVRCPISLEEFGRNDHILRIRHCKHIFKEESLLNWFRRNVRCPVCRYDIRDYRRPRGSRDVSNNDIQRTRMGGGAAGTPTPAPTIGPAIPQRQQPPVNTTEITLQELVNNIISDFTQDSTWNHFDMWNPPNAPGIITNLNTTSPSAIEFIPSNRINLNHLINNMNVIQNNRSHTHSHSLYSENMETLLPFDDTQEDVDSVS
jgi:hypothetical protein